MMIIYDSKDMMIQVMDKKKKLDEKNTNVEIEYKEKKQRQVNIKDRELKKIEQDYMARVIQIEKDNRMKNAILAETEKKIENDKTALIGYKKDTKPSWDKYKQTMN
eukprot:276331_1